MSVYEGTVDFHSLQIVQFRILAPYSGLRLRTVDCGSVQWIAAPYSGLRLHTVDCGSVQWIAAPYSGLWHVR